MTKAEWPLCAEPEYAAAGTSHVRDSAVNNNGNTLTLHRYRLWVVQANPGSAGRWGYSVVRVLWRRDFRESVQDQREDHPQEI